MQKCSRFLDLNSYSYIKKGCYIFIVALFFFLAEHPFILFFVSLYSMIRFRNTQFLVTKDGRVFSEVTNKFLKPATDGNGYLRCAFKHNGKHTTFKMHRLVAECYIPNPLNKPQVNHIDGNKKNNNVDNLEWCTEKENTEHAIRMGLFNPKDTPKEKCINKIIKKGELNGCSKLTEKEVLEIREKFKPRVYTREMLALEYNVKASTIKDVILRKSWKHI